MAGKKESKRRTPRQARSRETRRAILEAATRLVREVGRDAVTTKRVAEVAGVSVGSLYEYFATREELLKAVEETDWHLDTAAYVTTFGLADGTPPGEGVRRVVLGAVEVLARGGYQGLIDPDPEVVERGLATIDAVARAARAAFERNQRPIRRPDADLALQVAIKAIVALTWLGVRDEPKALEDGRWATEIADLVVRYLVDVKDPPPPSA